LGIGNEELRLFDRRRQGGLVYAALAAQRLRAASIFMSYSPGGSILQESRPAMQRPGAA